MNIKNASKSNKFLHAAIDINPNLVFIKDRKGRFLLANQAVAEIYGTTVENLIGKTDADFNPKLAEVNHFRNDDLEVIEKRIEKRIAEEPVTDASGKTRFFQTVKRPLTDPDTGEIVVLGVATDVTQLKKLQEQLHHSQKMEAIGQLAGGVAHDFNNILTGILGYAALLKNSHSSDKKVLQTAEFIEKHANRAGELTQKLLGFARKGKHRSIQIDLHTATEEALHLLSRTVEKNISLHVKLNAKNPYILGDPVQIQQIILNLAINSRDAMTAELGGTNGGQIILSSANLNLEPGDPLLEETLPPGNYVEFSVEDTGCGIPRDLLHRVFEPFFTTKDPERGTGMGLSMVYGIVKNHGGTIRIESNLLKGTTVRILLPSLKKKSRRISERKHIRDSIEVTRTGSGQILVVDDHSVIRDVTARMLRVLGYDVVTARDGIEAIRYYSENAQSVDLVILDMVMPRMGAKECFKEIKRIDPTVKAILCTGYVNNHAVEEIMREGLVGFMQKPYQIDKLSKVVSDALRG